MIRIVNLETGEVTEREFNAKELKQQEIDAAAEVAHNQAKQVAAEARATAKAALLAKLGITADEAKLLLS